MSAPFRDRLDGARRLVPLLREYENPLILAIPRGAVPLGRYLADALGGELDVVLVHKLGAPGEAEVAVGSVDEHGHIWRNPETIAFVSEEYLQREAAAQVRRLQERRARITSMRRGIDRSDRNVLVVDDGVATASTMMAALVAVRADAPRELVAAAPVMSSAGYARVASVADAVVAPIVSTDFYAVGQFYQRFEEVTDDDVVRLLGQSETTAVRSARSLL
jgi:predicted phosphoribosyltransferase